MTNIDMERVRQCMLNVTNEFFADSTRKPTPAARNMLVNELIHALGVEIAKQQRDSSTNHITGTVHGIVIQARNIDGGIRP